MTVSCRDEFAGNPAPYAGLFWRLDLADGSATPSQPLAELLGTPDFPLAPWSRIFDLFSSSDRTNLELAGQLWARGQLVPITGLTLPLPDGPISLELSPILLAPGSIELRVSLPGGTLPEAFRQAFGRLTDFAIILFDRELRCLDATGPELLEVGLRRPGDEAWIARLPDPIREQLRQALQTTTMATPQTCRFWLERQYYLVTSSSGTVDSGPLLTIWHNLTLRKHLSEVTAEAASSGPSGAWELDCLTQQLIWEEPTRQIFRSQEAPALADWLVVFQGRSRNELEEAILRCIQEGEPFDLTLDCVLAPRTRSSVRVLGRSIWRAGQVVRLVGCCVDVSDSKLQNDTARVETDRAQTLLKAWPEAFLVLDFEGTIKQVHLPDTYGLAGLVPESAGRPFRMVFPSLGQYFSSEAESLFKGGRARPMEFTLPVTAADDSPERRYEVRVLMFDGGGGRPVRYAVVFKDLTNYWERGLEMIRGRNEAVEASKIKSQFLANMSHEIRTPLNGVLGMTELVLGTPLNTEQRECLEAALQSGRSLLQIVDDILDLSKIEADRLELESIPFSVRQVARECLNGVAVRAHIKKLELLVGIDSAISPMVMGDPVRFKQILNNLLSNAVKFTDKGEVELEITQREPDWLRVNVFDSGVGIPAEQQGQIFEPFIQADGATTRNFGGTGLGLAICKQLVEKMEGQIWIESAPGQGSRFSLMIRLPRYQASDLVGPTANLMRDLARDGAGITPELGDAMQQVRILIMDDNAASRRVLKTLVGAWGIQAVTVADAEGALLLLREAAKRRKPFHVFLFDHPEDPLQSAALGAYQEQGLVKLLMTTLGRAVDLQLADGLAATITKPIQAADLAEALVTHAVRGGSELALHFTPAAVTPTSVEGNGAKILLAEDNQINAKVVSRILQGLGFEVVHVVNGQMALEELERNKYALALMDVQMPVMDGLQATRRWRQREAVTGQHLVIIALTANAMMGDRERCLEYGMDHYLTKPIQRERLIEALYQVGGQSFSVPTPVAH